MLWFESILKTLMLEREFPVNSFKRRELSEMFVIRRLCLHE